MELIQQADLGPKEVATALGISESGAKRLMRSGQIASMRAGERPWRTTAANVAAYQKQQFVLAQTSPRVRGLMQSIACFREIERLCVITPEQTAMMLELEQQLLDRQARRGLDLAA